MTLISAGSCLGTKKGSDHYYRNVKRSSNRSGAVSRIMAIICLRVCLYYYNSSVCWNVSLESGSSLPL